MEEFATVLEAVSAIQTQIYGLDQAREIEHLGTSRLEDMRLFEQKLDSHLRAGTNTIVFMQNAIDVTLTALGDVFR